MRYLILLFGVFSCATSVVFIRIGATDPVPLSAYRLLIGGSLLLPLALRHGLRGLPLPGLVRRAWAPALLLAVHFGTWNTGARLTPSAHATLIVNMVPVVMPLLLVAVLGERITRAEAAGTAVALAGVLLLAAGDLHFSREHAMGDAVCFLSMLFYAGYLVFGRKNRDLPSVHLYVVPVYLLAGLACLLWTILLELAGSGVVWLGPDRRTEWLSIMGLALVPTVLGHSIINWSLRVIRGQAVVILNLAQFVFAGILGFLLLGEVPRAPFYAASLLVVAGALIVIRGAR